MFVISTQDDVADTTAAVDVDVPRTTARQLITNFLESHQPGIEVNLKRNTLNKAAEDMFTAKGVRCPVLAIERNGSTYLINRDLVSNSGTA